MRHAADPKPSQPQEEIQMTLSEDFLKAPILDKIDRFALIKRF
jgi:hypothetical protein